MRVVLGVLLLAAAALKLAGMGADPVARMGVFSTPEFQLTVVVSEAFLAVWLLSGKNPVGSWLVSLGVFGLFAVVSFYQGTIGQSSCGCFGRLSVSPWAAFGLDVLILGALLVGRPYPTLHPGSSITNLRSALVPFAWGIAGVVVIGGLLVGGAHLIFGSVPAAIAYLRGERVSISPRLVDVGQVSPGETRATVVTITNWTDGPIQLCGGTADCSCTVLNDLPLTIEAKQSREVTVEVRLSGQRGIFTRRAAFLIDDQGVQRVEFRLTGQISGMATATQ